MRFSKNRMTPNTPQTCWRNFREKPIRSIQGWLSQIQKPDRPSQKLQLPTSPCACSHRRILRRYVATGDSMDKAGAYGAQGRASAFIQSISGCFYNVVGLPLACFWSLYHRLAGQSLWAIIPENRDATNSI
ncbi:dTTP/UTP pyrophosphatase [Geodia barretti]|nr:dTTP/UTP pyrophosphatase [Geodia barretti]